MQSANELIFQKIPQVLGLTSIEPNVLAKSISEVKELFDEAVPSLTDKVAVSLRDIFSMGQPERASLQSIIQDWCESLPEGVSEELFEDGTDKFLSVCQQSDSSESEWLLQLARIATGLRFNDWDQNTLKIFCDKVTHYKKTAECYVGETKNSEIMKNVSELQKKYNFYKKSIIELSSEKEKLLEEKGSLRTNRDRYGTLMNELALKDENNKKIAEYEAYATYMYQKIEEEYNNKEKEVREGLEKRVNAIYKQIFNGDFSIVLDEKYNISILDNDFADSVDDADPSTAQGISVVFAFIAGTIDMACENSSKENAAFSTEVYPLVMDAPLSAFDKTRIQSVCDILPKVAEQVIIFIKDTDGDIAEEHMGDKVGLRYQFEKRQNYVTEIVER